MTTSTSPSGGNAVSVLGISTSSRARLRSDNRLSTTRSSPVVGLTALQPVAAVTIDTRTSSRMNPWKMKTGSGSAFPSRSILSSALPLRVDAIASACSTSDIAAILEFGRELQIEISTAHVIGLDVDIDRIVRG